MTCAVCKQELDQGAPYVTWFSSSPYKGAHHLRCPKVQRTGSPEQRARALKAANEVRLSRAKLKRDVAGCLITIPDALEHPAAQSMSLYHLLRLQPQWGDRKTEAFLRPLLISPYKLIGGLTARQRVAVVRVLEENTQ